MTDIAIIWVNGAGDITVNEEEFDLLSDNSLTNAVIISLFTDRAIADDELEKDQQNRGWWGDSFSDEPWGSKLWTLARSKSLQSVADDAEDFAYQALNWMIDENLIDSLVAKATRESTTNSNVKDMLHLNIKLSPSDGSPQRELKFIIEGGV
ncbi:phage GP46 family protein [Ignatzschineria rhizosphaerae]|uniref:Phage GP46 family protein n=1 Tax=Ignatzschineria rhizosphaerae TaxID=2923279 RepID=A0ABY3X044_9GAMM|nr:phage GP46 family protein [Ignatzschineria rhizosphaerae]UNM95660.1 phage GP46 family protein [Ignatzschineria rhizosphaerae]